MERADLRACPATSRSAEQRSKLSLVMEPARGAERWEASWACLGRRMRYRNWLERRRMLGTGDIDPFDRTWAATLT